MPTTDPQTPPARLALIVMGVSGSGKTTVGLRLAKLCGADFIDGDDLHSPEARAKMARGTPLTDEDRWPWLDRIGAALADRGAHPGGLIVACSALRRAYRDRLRAGVGPDLRFVFLEGDKALMRSRVGGRKGHYMPASLVDSQFATLEDPRGESDVVTLAADADLARGLPEALRRLGGAWTRFAGGS
jgi:gluconokinase